MVAQGKHRIYSGWILSSSPARSSCENGVERLLSENGARQILYRLLLFLACLHFRSKCI